MNKRTETWMLKSLVGAVVVLSFFVNRSIYSESTVNEFLPEGQYHEVLFDPRPALPDELDFQIDLLNSKSTPAKKVAIYNDEGVWEMGLKHTKRLMSSAKLSYSVINAKDILNGVLQKDIYDLLVMPGGKSWIYLDSLGEKGAESIRQFVANGGSYFGTCAGAFYATARRTDSQRDNEPYGIGLLDGTAYDGTALKTAPFKSGMMNIDYNLKNFKKDYRVLMLGGPAFIYSEEEAQRKNIQVLSTFEGFGKPAFITFNYEKGRVLLSGPHGEIEEKKAYWGTYWKDPDSEWPVIRKMLAYLKGGAMPELNP